MAIVSDSRPVSQPVSESVSCQSVNQSVSQVSQNCTNCTNWIKVDYFVKYRQNKYRYLNKTQLMCTWASVVCVTLQRYGQGALIREEIRKIVRIRISDSFSGYMGMISGFKGRMQQLAIGAGAHVIWGPTLSFIMMLNRLKVDCFSLYITNFVVVHLLGRFLFIYELDV